MEVRDFTKKTQTYAVSAIPYGLRSSTVEERDHRKIALAIRVMEPQ